MSSSTSEPTQSTAARAIAPVAFSHRATDIASPKPTNTPVADPFRSKR